MKPRWREPLYYCVSALTLEGKSVVYGPFRSSVAALAWARGEPAIQAGWEVVKMQEPQVLEVSADVG